MLIYGSKEFWDALRPEIVATIRHKNGKLFGCERGNIAKDAIGYVYTDREGSKAFWTLECLNIDPASIPPWEESLIHRPLQWREADETTPIDTLVWSPCKPWRLRYYAGNGEVWVGGCTSKTSIVSERPSGPILIADHGDEKPPEDYGA